MSTPDPIGPPRCTAHSKQTGAPCKQRPAAGLTVCHYHGGAAPQTIAAGRRRLLDLLAPALARLATVVADDDDPRSLQAARDILDRLGLREPEAVQVITVDWVEAEIARLEAELAEQG